MPLGMEVGLGPGHIVLDVDPAPLPKKGAELPPKFSAHVSRDHTAGWIKMAVGMEVGKIGDLEWRNGPYFALFHRIFVYGVAVKQLLGLPRNQNQNLFLIFCDHINTICTIIQRLFWQNKSRQWPPLQTVVAYAHVS